MGCGVVVLTIYAFVASLVVLVLGSLLVTMDGCDEDSLAKSCKDLKVETGGTLTEVHNRILQLDILNQDNGKAGSTGVDCPVCSVSLFSTLEIIALTLLGALFLANLGRFTRYIVKLVGKHKLKKENAKLQQTAETRRQIRKEMELERGISSNMVSVKSNEDDQEIKGKDPSWEEAVLS